MQSFYFYCFLIPVLFGTVAIGATTSGKTEKVVGFKPEFKNSDGRGAVNGELAVGKTISVNSNLLGYYDRDGDLEDKNKTEYRWLVDNKELSRDSKVVLPDDSLGKKLVLEVTPYSLTGDPIMGKTLRLTDLKSAGATGGDSEGNISLIKPQISNLRIQQQGIYLQPGIKIMATYTFVDNGGASEGKSRFEWGGKGSTNELLNSEEIVEPGKIEYIIKKSDIGKVLELSVLPVNKDNVSGTIATKAHFESVKDSTPKNVTVHFTSTATVEKNGVSGVHPVVNNDVITALVVVEEGISDDPSLFSYEWKVDGKPVGPATVGRNTFIGRSEDQGKKVSVNVLPK
ncbi:hypothetical protein [Aeromonas veronii]|uniref:hypothetical protein n=1 Tax=Aeromonas veronii TaxID=654 RepID=UPI000D8F02D4